MTIGSPSSARWGWAAALAALLCAGCATSGALSAEEINDGLASEDPQVRRAIAANPTCSPEALDALAKDKDDAVRARVAENPSTKPATVKKLADDRALPVIEALARNPRTPPDRLTALARGFKPEAAEHRFWQDLVDNQGLPLEVRLELLGKLLAEQDRRAGVAPPVPERLNATAGTWKFPVEAWTRRSLSGHLESVVAQGGTSPALSAVKAVTYTLGLSAGRVARLDCPGCATLIGAWALRGDQLDIRLRNPGGPSWRIEGAAPAGDRAAVVLETSLPVRYQSFGWWREADDTARWDIELQRAP